jgi:hypothetical protein
VKLDLSAQIKEALECAITRWGAPISYNLANIPEVSPPESAVLDQRIADVIRGQLAWAPHIIARWDHSNAGSTLVFRSGLQERGDPNRLHVAKMTELTEFRGIPRYDLLTPFVAIRYVLRTWPPQVSLPPSGVSCRAM